MKGKATMKPFQVAPGVYQVGGPDLTSGNDCCVYLVDHGYPVLIDAGAGTSIRSLLDNIREVGYDPAALKAVIITHCHIDHVGGAPYFAEELGLPLIMHELDAPVVEEGDNLRSAANFYGMELKPLKIKRKLAGEEGVFHEGYTPLHWLHTPGHTPGSISLWLDTGLHKVLFAQDVHGPFYDVFKSNIDDWAVSMHKLIELEADVLCEGHFGIYRPASEARRYIEDYLRSYGKL